MKKNRVIKKFDYNKIALKIKACLISDFTSRSSFAKDYGKNHLRNKGCVWRLILYEVQGIPVKPNMQVHNHG